MRNSNIQRSESQAVVRTERIEIVDDKGNVCVKIGVFEEGPAVRLYDENGRPRIGLGMTFLNQPQLICYDQTTTRMYLSLNSDGEPHLAMLDSMTAHAAKSLWKRWEEEERQREQQHQQRTKKAKPAKEASPHTEAFQPVVLKKGA